MKLHGLDTYLVEPPEGRKVKGIIVLIPDAFGIEFVNNKLLADSYARKGDYKVYLPDFMFGTSHKNNPIKIKIKILTCESHVVGRSCPSWFLDSMKILASPGNYLSKP